MTKMKKTSNFLLVISQPFLKLQQDIKKENFQKRSGYIFGNYTFYAKSDGLRVISPES